MIEWVNFILLLIFAFLSSYYYVKSASIVQLEKKIGPAAYKKCSNYRYTSLVFLILIFVNYIIYYFYPLPVPLPQKFPVNWGILIIIAILMAIPLVYIYYRAVKDAGVETMHPH